MRGIIGWGRGLEIVIGRVLGYCMGYRVAIGGILGGELRTMRSLLKN